MSKVLEVLFVSCVHKTISYKNMKQMKNASHSESTDGVWNCLSSAVWWKLLNSMTEQENGR